MQSVHAKTFKKVFCTQKLGENTIMTESEHHFSGGAVCETN